MTRYSIPLAAFTVAVLLSNEINLAYAETKNSACLYVWSQNLKVGSIGDDVLKLQQFLNSSLDTQIAQTGAGSPGKETKKYGGMTAKAVSKFQEKYKSDILSPAGLTRGTGALLGMTRSKLNAICTGAPATTPVSTTNNAVQVSSQSASVIDTVEIDALTVGKPEQPRATSAPANAGSVQFTNVTLTAGSKDVTVNNLTIERTGPAADGSFYSISLYNEAGKEIGKDGSLGSNHRVILGSPFVIPAHTSTTISVMGNMNSDLANYAGQVPTLQVVAINTSSPINGELPINGTSQPINDTLIIGGSSAALSQFDPGAASNRYINDRSVRFSGIRVTAHSEEALRLGSISWDQVGTAGESDIENIVTIVNGVSYPTKVNNKVYTSTFDPQVVIPKGQSVDVYIQGDIRTSGSNRTVQFNLKKSDSVWLIGDTYGFDVGVAAESNTDVSGNSVFITSDGTTDGNEGSPFFSGSVATINAGTFSSIGKSN